MSRFLTTLIILIFLSGCFHKEDEGLDTSSTVVIEENLLASVSQIKEEFRCNIGFYLSQKEVGFDFESLEEAIDPEINPRKMIIESTKMTLALSGVISKKAGGS